MKNTLQKELHYFYSITTKKRFIFFDSSVFLQHFDKYTPEVEYMEQKFYNKKHH